MYTHTAPTGGIDKRRLRRLKEEADSLGSPSMLFAFAMAKQKAEKQRRTTIQVSKFLLRLPRSRCGVSVLDVPGHSDFLKNATNGLAQVSMCFKCVMSDLGTCGSCFTTCKCAFLLAPALPAVHVQADVGILVVPADDFERGLARGNRAVGRPEGACRLHALALRVSGVKQLVVAVNKMDAVGYSRSSFLEVVGAISRMLKGQGWKVHTHMNHTSHMAIRRSHKN